MLLVFHRAVDICLSALFSCQPWRPYDHSVLRLACGARLILFPSIKLWLSGDDTGLLVFHHAVDITFPRNFFTSGCWNRAETFFFQLVSEGVSVHCSLPRILISIIVPRWGRKASPRLVFPSWSRRKYSKSLCPRGGGGLNPSWWIAFHLAVDILWPYLFYISTSLR